LQRQGHAAAHARRQHGGEEGRRRRPRRDRLHRALGAGRHRQAGAGREVMARRFSLSFKQRIWLIPQIAILAFLVGVALTLASNRAASHLVSVDEPFLENSNVLSKALEDIRYTLQSAAQEGDKRGVEAARSHADRARAAIAGIRGIAGKEALAGELE